MNLNSFEELLNSKKIEYKKNENMEAHTTFKIGGNADIFVLPKNVEELSFAVKSAKQNDVPVFVIGKGSNILVSDNGIEGAVISLIKFNNISVKGNIIKCGGGLSLYSLCTKALESGLTGLEFAFGIPGSVGGAMFMNAGAYGGEMSQVVKSAYCLDSFGNEIFIEKKDMDLSYRNSIFKQKNLIVSEVVFELKNGDKDKIKETMNDLLSRRKEKQPLEFPSAGSTFKRPLGNFAGALIEKSGLKGYSIGGAKVSEKHAGFLVNSGEATAKDVLLLMEKVKKTVFANDGIMLEPEVIFVGRK
ncbi:MAG: UDP-N-acetylmuramate dehydrogenase [Clostridia bacterium]|nr:UDP-N-acetylmuramate dehydrogenase [Clostridia bacterium]